ncbi:hypothetical protein E2C01_080319 [Portunus trituberculatus]|uniref:Uncharacterized protein n=1 Tax=Portunus trituberculatus TaxID=210409 RepID=A0A5B7IY34_PORTR|nr:hypothetical protein [Portunus trituberculatus]
MAPDVSIRGVFELPKVMKSSAAATRPPHLQKADAKLTVPIGQVAFCPQKSMNPRRPWRMGGNSCHATTAAAASLDAAALGSRPEQQNQEITVFITKTSALPHDMARSLAAW